MTRSLLIPIFAAGCVLLAGSWAASAGTSPTAAAGLQTWIAGNAAIVRTLDAADEDFSDLEPLVKAIGAAQVVTLGEPGHGAGTSFAAKVRLVKFLHQRMGFDVLV